MKLSRFLVLLGFAAGLTNAVSVALVADPLVDYKYASDALAAGPSSQVGYTQNNHYYLDFSQQAFVSGAVGSTIEAAGANCFLQDGGRCHSGELIQTAQGVAVDFDYDYAVFNNGQYYGPTHIETSGFEQVDFFEGASLGSNGTYTDGRSGYLDITAAPEPASWGVAGIGIIALMTWHGVAKLRLPQEPEFVFKFVEAVLNRLS